MGPCLRKLNLHSIELLIGRPTVRSMEIQYIPAISNSEP